MPKAACGPACSAAGACSAIRRTGELLDEIRLPCSAVTKAAFARRRSEDSLHHHGARRADAEERKQQPLAGGLFRARVDVPGLPQGIVSHGI